MFLAECWRLETSSRLFYHLIKTTIQQELAIFNGWHIPFSIVLYSTFQKMKHWNLDIFGYWIIGAGCEIKKDLESSPSPPNCSKNCWQLLHLLISINWRRMVTLWVVVQKIYSKMHLVSCTNTHGDVTDLVNHGMVKNTKIWISWEWNIIFLWNKKFLNLRLRWHILRTYRFFAEVTFKHVILIWHGKMQYVLFWFPNASFSCFAFINNEKLVWLNWNTEVVNITVKKLLFSNKCEN